MAKLLDTDISCANNAALNLELVKYVSQFITKANYRRAMDSVLPKCSVIVNAITAKLVESLAWGETLSKAQSALAQRAILSRFLGEYEKNSSLYFNEIIVPTAFTFWAEEPDLILERYGKVVDRITPSADVDGAVAMAWLNLRRAQQRWLFWLNLGTMTAYGSVGSNPDLSDTFRVVERALVAEIQAMERPLLMFSLLAGGDTANRAKEWVLKTKLSDGMAVMNYLEYDGVLPSSWRTEDEKQFRASFQNYA